MDKTCRCGRTYEFNGTWLCRQCGARKTAVWRSRHRYQCTRCGTLRYPGTQRQFCRICRTARFAPTNLVPTETELAWSVAWVDAEGSITARAGTPAIVVAQKNREILDRLQPILGGAVYGPYEASRCYYLHVTGKWARRLLLVLRDHPLLSSKRRAEVERGFLNSRLRLWTNDVRMDDSVAA